MKAIVARFPGRQSWHIYQQIVGPCAVTYRYWNAKRGLWLDANSRFEFKGAKASQFKSQEAAQKEADYINSMIGQA